MKFFAAAALLVAGANGLANHGRRLDTVDVINQLVDGQTFEIPEDQIPVSGVTVEGPMVCTGLELGDLQLVSLVDDGTTDLNGVSMEYVTEAVEVSDLLIECTLPVSVIGISIEIYITSEGSNVYIAWDLLSQDFSRLIPSTWRVDDELSCDNVDDILDLDIDSDTSGGFLIDAIVAGELESLPDDLCPTVYDLATNLSKAINETELILSAVFRPPVTEDIVAAVVAAETSLESALPENFTYYDEAEFNAFLDDLLAKYVATEFGNTTYTAVVDLIAAWEAADNAGIEAAIESFLGALFGSTVDVDSDLVVFVVGKVNEIIAIVEDMLNDVVSIADGVPQIIDAAFAAVDAVLSNIPIISVSVEEVVLLFDEPNWFTDFLQTFGNETDIGTAITQIWTTTTVGDLLAFIPADSPVVPFLESFGTDTLLSAGVAELVETVKSLFGDFVGEGGISITIDDPLTESMVSVLNIIATFVPEAQDVIADIIAANNLRPLSEMFTFNFALGDFGNATIALYSFALDLDLAIVDTDSGPAGVSSYVTPGIDLSRLALGVGVELSLLKPDGALIVTDVVTVSAELAIFAQVGATFGMELSALDEFGFSEVTNVLTAVPVGIDFVQCGISAAAIALSGQKVSSSFSASLSSANGEFAGFIEDLANRGLELYAPLPPTLLELIVATFVPMSEFWSFPDLRGTCALHPVA